MRAFTRDLSACERTFSNVYIVKQALPRMRWAQTTYVTQWTVSRLKWDSAFSRQRNWHCIRLPNTGPFLNTPQVQTSLPNNEPVDAPLQSSTFASHAPHAFELQKSMSFSGSIPFYSHAAKSLRVLSPQDQRMNWIVLIITIRHWGEINHWIVLLYSQAGWVKLGMF